MISIQTAMLVGLGFLIASLLAVLLMPAYRARTVRLTSDRVRALLPTTELELKADKDRIRADNALRVHRLESQLEHLKFGAARQMVEVNRRDGLINSLNGNLENMQGELEVAQNARNVLEQTIADRLPKVEQRLIEAKKLLFQRDREITHLAEDTSRTQRALVEAVQINAQQSADIERLNMVLDTRAAQNRDGLSDPTFDAELALRAEIEALRARSRDQTSVIERLRGGATEDEPATGSELDNIGHDATAMVPEVVRLQRDLVRAETALKALRDMASAGQAEQSEAASIVRLRDQKIEDQALQIVGLTAALRAFEEGLSGDRSSAIKDSKIAMKSRLSALQVQSEAQTETIRKLRAEAAASNERLARQAQHFMEEMRRLGAGTLPASAQVRRPATAAGRRSLTQRIGEAKPALVAASSSASGGANSGSSRPVLVKSDAQTQDVSPAAVQEFTTGDGANDTGGKGQTEEAQVTTDQIAPAPLAADMAVARPSPVARPRLLDRITDYGKG